LGLEEQRLYEMVKLKKQFLQILKDHLGFEEDESSASDSQEDPIEAKKRKRNERRQVQC